MSDTRAACSRAQEGSLARSHNWWRCLRRGLFNFLLRRVVQPDGCGGSDSGSFCGPGGGSGAIGPAGVSTWLSRSRRGWRSATHGARRHSSLGEDDFAPEHEPCPATPAKSERGRIWQLVDEVLTPSREPRCGCGMWKTSRSRKSHRHGKVTGRGAVMLSGHAACSRGTWVNRRPNGTRKRRHPPGHQTGAGRPVAEVFDDVFKRRGMSPVEALLADPGARALGRALRGRFRERTLAVLRPWIRRIGRDLSAFWAGCDWPRRRA